MANWVVQVERAGRAEPVVPGERVARAERVAQAERAAQFLARSPTPTPIRSWWMRSSFGREGTIVVPENPTPPLYTYYAPGLPPTIDDVTQMERWEPWVRAYIAIGEMMRGSIFRRSGNAFQVRSFVSGSPSSLIAEIQRPAQTTFEEQIPLVLSWAELRNERATEIMAQIDPQYAFWSSIVYMHPDRTKRTFELINMVLQFCVYVEMRFKQALACWRPVEYNAQVQPMITTPGHGTFPRVTGRNTYAVAYVLRICYSSMRLPQDSKW